MKISLYFPKTMQKEKEDSCSLVSLWWFFPPELEELLAAMPLERGTP